MKNNRTFYKCNICGNLVAVVEDGGVTPQCCGQDMEALAANTVDASTEKHIPAATVQGKEVHVQVGEVEHPQTQEHHISFIALAQGKQTQWLSLDPTGKPTGVFDLREKEAYTLYAYCNLHGLWAKDFDAE